MARQSVVSIAFALSFVTTILGATSAAAQQSALLKGVVADAATGKLIPSATVTVVGSEMKSKTGEDGTFVFPEAPLGKILVRVQAEGYPAVVEATEMMVDVPNVLPVFLESAVAALDGIVTFTGRRDSTEPVAKNAADLLARAVPEIRSAVGKPGGGRFPIRILLRGRNTISGDQAGEPMVVLDGVRMNGGIGFAMDRLRQISATNVKNLQIIRGSTGAFLYGAADGVIIIETFGH